MDSTTPTSVVEQPLLETLSPSRASTFKQCPQLYKFTAIDKLETKPTVHQARGTTVHLALERLFELPADQRTAERLYDLFRQAWVELRDVEYPELFATIDEERAWGIDALSMLATYFSIEDPTSFEPLALEMDLLVDVDHMTIRGILDRMEEVTETTPDGATRKLLVITDYKTGRAPQPRFAEKAFFALKIYALLIRTSQGVTPDRIRLLYLNGPTELTMDIDNVMLDTVGEHLTALWSAIENAIRSDEWPTSTSRLCDWCDFKETHCPAFVDTPLIEPSPA